MVVSRRRNVSTGAKRSSAPEPIPTKRFSQPEATFSYTWSIWAPALLLFGICFGAALYNTFWLPNPISADAPLSVFSAERAMVYTRYLSDEIGLRGPGAKVTHGRTMDYLLQEISSIVTDHHREDIDVDIRLQAADIGGYLLTFESIHHVEFGNSYSNLTNIVVEIGKPGMVGSAPAIIVNAHFDTTVGSPGASDDGTPIGIMMELIRNLLNSDPLEHPVILLFNSAEELLLHAGHSFVAHDESMPRIKALLNLEAAGAGGPSILFRVGPENYWLHEAYAAATPYPHASPLAQDVFELDLIPSDTDYRIFKTFGHKPGLDTAIYRNGQIYHTHIDDMAHAPLSTCQQMGANTLALVKELTKKSVIRKADDPAYSETRGVLVDVMGLATVALTRTMWFGTCVGAAVLSLAVLCVRVMWLKCTTWQRVADSSKTMFAGMLGGIVCAVLFALAIDNLQKVGLARDYVWYSYPLLAAAMYTVPTMFGFAIIHSHFHANAIANHSSRAKLEEDMSAAVVVCSAVLTVLFTAVGLSAAYLFASFALCGAFGRVAVNTGFLGIKRESSSERSREFWVQLFACSIPLVAVIDNPFLGFVQCFGPIMGRAGVHVIPELGVGAVAAFFLSTCILLPLVPIYHRAGNVKFIRNALGMLCIGLVVSTNFLPTFTRDAPLRLLFSQVWDSDLGPESEQTLLATGTLARASMKDALMEGGANAHARVSELRAAVETMEAGNGAEDAVAVSAELDALREELSYLEGALPLMDSIVSRVQTPFNTPEEIKRGYYEAQSGGMLDPFFPVSLIVDCFTLPAKGLPSLNIPPPSVAVVREESTSSGGRKLFVRVETPRSHFTTVRFDANLLAWSVTDTIPVGCEDSVEGSGYFVRHVSGYPEKVFDFWIELADTVPVVLEVSSTRFGCTMEGMMEMLPEWTTSTCIGAVYSTVEV